MYKLSIFIILSIVIPASARAACDRRIAIVPPQVSNPRFGRALVNQYLERHAKAKPDDCSPFIDYEKTVDIFDTLGFTSYFTLPPSTMSPRKIAILREEWGLTHLLFLIPADASKQVLKANLYRVDGDKDLVRIEESTFPAELPELEPYQISKPLSYLTLFVPNNFAIGTSNTQVHFDLNPAYEERSTSTKGTVPPIVSSITVSKIEHPNAYRNFDYGGSVFPGLFLYAINQDTYISKLDDTNETKKLQIATFGGCLNLNAEGSLFLPVGTLFSGLGWGPCLMKVRSEGRNTSYVTSATRFTLGYRAFVTERINLFFSWDSLNFNQNFYESDFANANYIGRYTLGVGYYITDAEGKFLDYWHRIL